MNTQVTLWSQITDINWFFLKLHCNRSAYNCNILEIALLDLVLQGRLITRANIAYYFACLFNIMQTLSTNYQLQTNHSVFGRCIFVVVSFSVHNVFAFSPPPPKKKCLSQSTKETLKEGHCIPPKLAVLLGKRQTYYIAYGKYSQLCPWKFKLLL